VLDAARARPVVALRFVRTTGFRFGAFAFFATPAPYWPRCVIAKGSRDARPDI
jgi:hypothetical protein